MSVEFGAKSTLAEEELTLFRERLQAWYAIHKRDLPWRRTQDAYSVWISEIMLQQTRVAAAIPYFERFLQRFPDVKALAMAPETDLLAHWAGLGYYYRARNLQRAARMVVESGRFPDSRESIVALPGVGDYTAAAIASISFGLPHAVLDGNVFRVLSRLFNDATNIAGRAARVHFAELADRLLDRGNPGAFNQAVMELGATVCLPKKPQCLVCPVADFCRGRAAGKQNDLPVKVVPQKNSKEERVVFWIERSGRVLLWQRLETSRLMPGFWELPESQQLPGLIAGKSLGLFRHGITVHNYVFEVKMAPVPVDLGVCQWIATNELNVLPVSTIVRKAWRVTQKAVEASPSALGAGR